MVQREFVSRHHAAAKLARVAVAQEHVLPGKRSRLIGDLTESEQTDHRRYAERFLEGVKDFAVFFFRDRHPFEDQDQGAPDGSDINGFVRGVEHQYGFLQESLVAILRHQVSPVEAMRFRNPNILCRVAANFVNSVVTLVSRKIRKLGSGAHQGEAQHLSCPGALQGPSAGGKRGSSCHNIINQHDDAAANLFRLHYGKSSAQVFATRRYAQPCLRSRSSIAAQAGFFELRSASRVPLRQCTHQACREQFRLIKAALSAPRRVQWHGNKQG